eukprot:s447_g25.t1
MEREVEAETLTVLGKPVLNGLFGVHKAWVTSSLGVTTRTLRLIVNLIPSNSVQKRLPIRPSEKMPCLARLLCDFKGSFWQVLLGRWNNAVKTGVKSAPIGWSNIERMGTLAGIPSSQVVRMGEPSPLLELRTPRDYYSFYGDNFHGFKIVAVNDLSSYEGKPERGLVGSAWKFRRAFPGTSIELLGKTSRIKNDAQELLSLAMNSGVASMTLPLAAWDDLMMITGMLPQHWMNQKLQLSPTACATDASEEGGRACSTIGLTARGRAKCHLSCCEANDNDGGKADPILLIEAFE